MPNRRWRRAAGRLRGPKIPTKQQSRAVLLGGAGFIGTTIANRLARSGWEVIVVDGFLPRTGARVEGLAPSIRLIGQPVEALARELPQLFSGAALTVDCMGWTRHVEALEDPVYDLSLNLASHLAVITALAHGGPRLFIYLGSRHQYGEVADAVIDEQTPFTPLDVQSVHKAAADHHYRLAARRLAFPIVALRFGNTFGPGQPIEGDDIGLVGWFLRTLLRGETLDVYAGVRRRNLVYAPDLAAVVESLAGRDLVGFQPFNLAGIDIGVAELARILADQAGTGLLVEKPMPPEVAAMEVGDARLDDSRLQAAIGSISTTDLTIAIAATIADIRQRFVSAVERGMLAEPRSHKTNR